MPIHMTVKHPAKFSDPIIDVLLEETASVVGVALDPFAGTGKVHQLQRKGLRTVGVEIEPEWAEIHPQTVVANALHLPFPDKTFDAIVTSPCMEQSHKILTSDLRWVPAGDIKEGQRIVAFDEHSPGVKANGHQLRRKYAFGEVVRSEPLKRKTLRVILANGDELLTTPEHPWLARKSTGYSSSTWIKSESLRPGSLVAKQLDVWGEPQDFRTGWTSGLMDGEGSLTMGVHGAPKLVTSQLDGTGVLDYFTASLELDGFNPNLIKRQESGVWNVYVRGGFPGILRALGTYRPMRLLSKWETLDISRSIQPDWIEVVAVEGAGERDIQQIETTTGTYISDGYLMHNCYGNRMADSHNAQDDSHRNTYTHVLGRKLHEDNAGAMQWGDKYRHFHLQAWMEAYRVLKPERGKRRRPMIVNISNHIRNGEEIDVTGWHISALQVVGFKLQDVRTVQTTRNRDGSNGDLRCPFESVLVLSR